jgi:hypothetical protein
MWGCGDGVFNRVNEFTWFPDQVRDDGLEQIIEIKQTTIYLTKILKRLDPPSKSEDDDSLVLFLDQGPG